MKKSFSIIAVILIVAISHAQQYSFDDINSQVVDKSLAGAVTDNSGNVIVYGSFANSITFENFTVTNSTPLNPSGQSQSAVFIGKKLSAGQFLWLNKIDLLPLNALSLAQINSMTTDASGNILMTGIFEGKVSFDNIVLTSTIINSPYGPGYSSDMFIAKLSSNGVFQWARLEGNSNRDCNGNEMGISIAVDNQGNVYAAGRLYDKELKGANTCLCNTNTPVSSAVIMKYNTAGVKLWDKRYSPTQPSKTDCNPGCSAWRVVADGNYVYLSGTIKGTVKFGTVTLSTGGDIGNTFVLKLDANGNPAWAKSISSSENSPNAMVIDNGNLYLLGHFSGTITFGGPTLTATTVSGYMAKYNLSGVCTWASMPGIISPNGNLIVNSNGNLAILRDYTLKEYSTSNGAFVDSTVSSNAENSRLYPAYPKLVRTSNGYMITENLEGSYDYGATTISSTQPVGGTYYDMIVINYTTVSQPLARPVITTKKMSFGTILYPNPTNNQITIRNKNNSPLGTIRIYNASGSTICQKFIGNSQTTIDVKNLPTGFYYISSDQATLKFVKQ